MALHWEEARVIVTCGGLGEVGDAPDDTIVIALKPEEVDEPETVEAVRNLVLDRTIERRQQILSDVYALGVSMPDPTVEEGEEDAEEATSAERTLLENLREREGEDEGDAGDEDDWAGGRPPVTEGGLLFGADAGRGVRIFISHVEELVVHN